MLIVFDKDGTLVEQIGGRRPPNTLAEQHMLPGVVEKCVVLRAEGHTLAIATNQGGAAFGHFTREDAHALVQAAAEAIGAALYAVCLTHPRGSRTGFARESEFRKPNPGMLRYLMDALGFDAANTLYVGDREEDRLTAQRAGVRFAWADAFFADHDASA